MESRKTVAKRVLQLHNNWNKSTINKRITFGYKNTQDVLDMGYTLCSVFGKRKIENVNGKADVKVTIEKN